VRLDPVLVDQPGKHLGRAVAAVAEEPARIGVEPFERALNHALGGQHLRLPDCRGKYFKNWLPLLSQSGPKRPKDAVLQRARLA
jgi:hypothetical protein